MKKTYTFLFNNTIVYNGDLNEMEFMENAIEVILYFLLSSSDIYEFVEDMGSVYKFLEPLVNDVLNEMYEEKLNEGSWIEFRSQEMFVSILWSNIFSVYYGIVLPIIKRFNGAIDYATATFGNLHQDILVELTLCE